MRFRVRTTAEAEDILISEMEEIGLDGAQIEDNVPLTAAEKEQMFVDILPEGPADDGKAFLSFFLEEKVSFAKIDIFCLTSQINNEKLVLFLCFLVILLNNINFRCMLLL